jgi:DNA invertase Pin-like site-specific DNA recombinase
MPYLISADPSLSTEDQTLQLQRPRLTAAGCEKVFEEKISGAARKRPRA